MDNKKNKMYSTYGIYNLDAIITKQTFGFIGRLCKRCNTIVQTLENAMKMEYSYGILGLKCCILIDDFFLIDDTFDGNIRLWFLFFMQLII